MCIYPASTKGVYGEEIPVRLDAGYGSIGCRIWLEPHTPVKTDVWSVLVRLCQYATFAICLSSKYYILTSAQIGRDGEKPGGFPRFRDALYTGIDALGTMLYVYSNSSIGKLFRPGKLQVCTSPCSLKVTSHHARVSVTPSDDQPCGSKNNVKLFSGTARKCGPHPGLPRQALEGLGLAMEAYVVLR